MALPINIDAVLQGTSVEWERLEFKQSWNPEPILHTLCAFANDFHNLDGGYVFIGIAETEGKPILPPAGLPLSSLDSLQKQILSLGYNIYPPYHPIVEPYTIDDKHILVLRASGGQNRPYKAADSLAKNNKAFSYYIRRHSSTVRASHAEEVELISLAAQVPFDDRMRQDAALSDLKRNLIQLHLSQIGSGLSEQSGGIAYEALCRKMGLVDGPSERMLPRNVGLMFFNEHPESFFPQAQIDVVQFPDGLAGPIIEKTFQGPISQQLNNALEYISVNVLKEYTVKREDRAQADRFWNYPYAALEEILANAVYHRSYELREPIEVRILPDRITVTSYPGPDRSISLDDLSHGTLIARRYRNRRIGEFLKELRLTEGRGTGIPTATTAMQRNGSPKPKFQTDDDRTYFTAILAVHPWLNKKNKSGGKSGGRPTFTPTFGNSYPSNKFYEMLLFCRTPRSRAHIQAHLGLRDLKNFRERYLYPSLKDGLLEMTDPDHPRAHDQKFRTTERGELSLSQTALNLDDD